MKGLLRNDGYTLLKTCKFPLIVMVIFAALSVADGSEPFFLFFPVFFGVFITPTLLTSDERSHWNAYCLTLPLSRKQYVCSKYLIGLLSQLAALILVCGAQALRMHMEDTFSFRDMGLLSASLILMNCLMSAVLYPVIFRYGSEKGRLIYLVAIGTFFAFIGFIPKVLDRIVWQVAPELLLPLLCAGTFLLYLLSWPLSVHLYQKREL